MVVIKDVGTSWQRAVKRRVRVEGKYCNWKRTVMRGVGHLVIVWGMWPGNFSAWMIPFGTMMVMGIRPGLWGRMKLRELEQWRKCR